MGSVMLVALGLTLVQLCVAQLTRKPAPPKGPRATGLLQLMPNGQAHLIPIVIMIDGKFYDAGSYKASPVPMALETGNVYEAFRSGVSEGLFTVTQVRQLKDDFIADGKWHVGSAEPEKKTASSPSKPVLDEDAGPPKLRRSSATPAPTEPPPSAPANATTPPANASTPPAPAAQATTAANTEPDIPETSAPEDPNRPTLHRGKPTKSAASSQKRSSTNSPAPAVSTPKPPAPSKAPAGTVEYIPAISDAHGPEPHPYIYDMKPDEEQKMRAKMLALAADEVRARDKQLTSASADTAPTRPGAKPRTAKPPQPTFDDIQFRGLDLSSSNEPTLVLTASARMPQSSAGTSDRQYYITLVARNDIYNELHKAFSNVTDSQHLDVVSRLDLIDAVDVDGDGRGELLFRETSDNGQGYVIYRVIGDQLYSLFNSRAGE